MADWGKIAHVGSTAVNVGMGGKQIWDANQSSEQAQKTLTEYAADLGMSLDEFMMYSQTAKDALADANGQLGRETAKVALNIPANLLPGGIVTGMVAGEGINRGVDAVAGVNEHLNDSMQGLGAAYAKVQGGQPIEDNDVGQILKAQLQSRELIRLQKAVDNGGADPNNLAVVYDELDTVVQKAELLLGRHLNEGESATQAIAAKLNEGRYSPAVLLVKDTSLPDILEDAPDFRTSPRGQSLVASAGEAAPAGTRPLADGEFMTDMPKGSSGQLKPQNSLPLPMGGKGGFKIPFIS